MELRSASSLSFVLTQLIAMAAVEISWKKTVAYRNDPAGTG